MTVILILAGWFFYGLGQIALLGLVVCQKAGRCFGGAASYCAIVATGLHNKIRRG